MPCYRHPTHDATGICHVCGKALCKECATDLGFALSCNGLCEERAKTYNRLCQNIDLSYRKLKKFRFLGPLFFILLALIFMASSQSFTDLCFMGGSLFLIFGITLFIIQKKWNDKIKI